VIDVGVGENNGIEILDGPRKLPVLIGCFMTLTPNDAAIERDGPAICANEMTGASDFTCGTDERNLQTAILLLPHRAETESLVVARPATSAPAPILLYFSHSGDQ